MKAVSLYVMLDNFAITSLRCKVVLYISKVFSTQFINAF